MAILWCGGEDIDFSEQNPPSIDNTSGHFRSAYCRCAIYTVANQFCLSPAFSGGAITSGWLTCRAWGNNPTSGIGEFGLGQTGQSNYLAIGPAGSSYPNSQVGLYKYVSGTWTLLALETGLSFVLDVIHKFDIQVLNYGTSGTVNVYNDGYLVVSYTGNITLPGVTGFDRVVIAGASATWMISEVIVANEDTRAIPGLQTLVLTGAGTTDQWSGGTYSNLNTLAFSDTTPAYSNTASQDEQYTIPTIAAGTYSIKAVKIVARAARSTDSTPTGIALGYSNGGSPPVVAVGSELTLTNAFETYESFNQINPITGLAFVQSDFNTLQLDLRSEA